MENLPKEAFPFVITSARCYFICYWKKTLYTVSGLYVYHIWKQCWSSLFTRLNIIFWAENRGVSKNIEKGAYHQEGRLGRSLAGCLQNAAKCVLHLIIFEKEMVVTWVDSRRFNIATSLLRLLLVFEVTVYWIIKILLSKEPR